MITVVVAGGIAAYAVSVIWVFVLLFGRAHTCTCEPRYTGCHRVGGAS